MIQFFRLELDIKRGKSSDYYHHYYNKKYSRMKEQIDNSISFHG